MSCLLSNTEEFRAVCLAAAAVLVFVAPTTHAEEWSDDFSGPIDPQFWSVWIGHPNFVVDDSGDDVYISNPIGGRGWGYFDDAGLCFAGHLSGNFNVSIGFRDLYLYETDEEADGLNEANLSVFFGGQDLAVARRATSLDGQTVVAWVAPPDESQGMRTSAASEGVMRIERLGALVTTFVNEHEVVSGTFNEAPVTGLCIRLATWGSVGTVSVRYDDFHVTADTIEFPTYEWRDVLVHDSGSDEYWGHGADSTAVTFHPDGSEAAIAYTDLTTGELEVTRLSWTGTAWVPLQPEVAAPDGRSVDLGYDACGDLWASYHYGDINKPSVGIAHWDRGTMSWSQRQVDRKSKEFATSIAADPLGTCGPPSITYGVDSGNQGQLRFVEGELPPVVVDSGPTGDGDPYPYITSAGVGSFSSLMYAQGNPVVAYSYLDDARRYTIKYAERDSTGWNSEVVTTYGRGIWDISLAHQAGVPVLVFSDYVGTLNFCERSDGWVCGCMPSVLGSLPSVVVDDQNTVVVSAERWGHMVYRRALGTSEWIAERTGAISSGDSAIDPAGKPAFCYRYGDEVHFVYQDTGGCETHSDCDDLNPCTVDLCGADGACSHEFVPDGDPCGDSGSCCTGQCITPLCSVELDCDDGDACTIDRCLGTYPCTVCEHEVILGCGCVPTASKEKGPRCTDGLDNDCDGMIDGEDPDC